MITSLIAREIFDVYLEGRENSPEGKSNFEDCD